MEYRLLGQTGLEVSVIGLGCNNFGGMIESLDLEGARKVVHAALDAGITLFDTSDSYGTDGGSEKALGEILGPRRHDIVLATKFASPLNPEKSSRFNASRAYIMKAVEDSLRRLKTTYIDLYQYHFPDPMTPMEETLRALDDLVRQGKVRYIGCSNFSAWQIIDADWISRHYGLHRFQTIQAEYSLLSRQAATELFPAMRRIGMTLLPYFPLASGLLTGKYRKGKPIPQGTRMSLPYFKPGLNEANLERVEKLIAFAEARGHTILELAIGWLLSQPIVTSVLIGATKPEQVQANVRSMGWRLTAEEMAELEKI
ncbi:MAG TPA: aldo/keto reductase [Bryobacteraceae bacterium]|nr:aldo/keto reductase [Bryobacteraceae bacterium]HOL69988.1 aldo/keto reductase [Bryobacteraceae bacterium]HOQ47031.1 aldo/keto reductase [Bryobacteraceae bacterium]HPQ16122.1 aldo/keto reductase [Bryobacteraceae bacterium]HPU71096.1 aldo/keto reductase [Bryobacteraceae bacterium]